MLPGTSMRAGFDRSRLASLAAFLASLALPCVSGCNHEKSKPSASSAPSSASSASTSSAHAPAARDRSGVSERNEANDPAAPNSPTADEVSESERPLKVPSGDAPRVTCAQARAIVAEVRRRLPAEPPPVSAPVFADLWADWFDPHGLWSAAPDAPLADAARTRAKELLSELESGKSDAPCLAAFALGEASKRWVDGLRGVFEQARSEARAARYASALAAINAPAF